MRTITRLDAAEALVSAAVTFAWYALPDAVGTRRGRAVAKAGLMVPVLAIASAQATRATVEAAAHDEPSRADDALARIRALTGTAPVLDASTISADGETDGRLPSARQVALVTAGVAALAGIAVGTVAAERGIYRFGERLGSRGVGHPHARIGVVAGALMGALSLASAALLPDR